MPDRRTFAPAAVSILLAAAAGWWLFDGPGSAERAEPPAASVASATPAPALARRRPGDPVRVVIPVLGVDAPVLPVRAPDRTLVPPRDPRRLGWWADGAKPGAAEGSALIAGHTVHTGGGALDDLEDLRRGDRVVVRTHRGRLSYGVVRVRTYSKGRLAQVAPRVFSQHVGGRLVLITCEDWDGERYLSNVVVTAVPAGP